MNLYSFQWKFYYGTTGDPLYSVLHSKWKIHLGIFSLEKNLAKLASNHKILSFISNLLYLWILKYEERLLEYLFLYVSLGEHKILMLWYNHILASFESL